MKLSVLIGAGDPGGFWDGLNFTTFWISSEKETCSSSGSLIGCLGRFDMS